MKPVVIGVALMLAGPAWGRAILLDGVAAVVNNHAVTLGDVMNEVRSRREELRKAHRDAALEAKLADAYTNALNDIVEQKLIVDAFEAQRKKTGISDEMIQRRVDAILREKSRGDRRNFAQALESQGYSLDAWRGLIRDRMVVSFMRSRMGERRGQVSPQALRDAYNQATNQLRVAKQVRMRMIVTGRSDDGTDAVAARKQAEDIRKRVLAGEDFASVAKAVSTDRKAVEGGDWGWLTLDMLRAELSKAVAALKTGQISEVVEVDGDYYIAKIEDRREASVASLQDVQPQIEKAIRQRGSEQVYRSWMDRLRKRGYVVIRGAEAEE